MSEHDRSRHHARRKAIFHDALDRSAEEREAFLQEACGGDESLLTELREMLVVEDSAAGFLESSTPGEVLAASMPEDRPLQLGPFRILRLIGEGGMGAVYEAEQERPRRSVALKVLHPGLGTPQMLRRFELEGEVLGRLTHPGIARIYEAGSGDTGRGVQPWFAMELVAGVPLTDYCRQEGLSTEDRLELIAKVADAVQHAHQRGIVHRDLKPGNVLVDAEGQPKVLDFGIARPTDGDLPMVTMQTDPGMIIGTLQYMSPEQASADPDAIDVRTDVYSLGVMLYELLAEQAPLDLRAQPMHEAVRRIMEEEPPALRMLKPRLHADLSVIAQTALAKDKDHRYASAAELAADLRRYLRREPIAAQPPSGLYRLQRFAARNKSLVAGAAATFLSLVLGLILTIWQRNEARENLARAEGINEFLLRDLIASPSPERLGHDVRVADVLAPAVLSAERSFKDQPRVAAEVLDAISASYRSLGLVDEAEPVARRALELLGEGTQDRLTLRARGNMVRILTDLDRAAEALPMGEQVVADSMDLLGVEDPDTLRRRVELAGARWSAGEVQSSLDELAAIAEDQARLLGAENPETLSTRSQLAVNLAGAGKVPEAQEVLRDTLASEERVLGPSHPSTLNSRSHLAWILTLGSEWEAGADLYAQHIPVLEKVYGPDHSYTALARVNHAQCLLQIRRAEEAEVIVRQGIASLEERLGAGHSSTLKGRLILAKSLYRQERYEEAIEMAEGVVARRREDESTSDNLGHALSSLGLCYQQAGEFEQAAETYREAGDVFRSVYGDDSDYVAQMQYNLAVVSAGLGNYDSAIPAYEEAIRIDAHNWGPDHGHVVSDRFNMARTLLEAKRPEQALAQINTALKSAATLNLDRLRILSYRQVLGQALIASGDSAEGERVLVEVVEGYAEQPDAQPAQMAAQALVALYEQQGRSAKAANYRQRLR